MKKLALIYLCSATFLSGCISFSEFREQMGINKDAPDEFAVVRHAPLEVPPPYALKDLPTPQPGAPRPQENTPDEEARQTLLGTNGVPQAKVKGGAASAADESFLKKAGVDQADPVVRTVIDAETAELHDRNKPVVERLFNYGGDAKVPSATVVDAKAESERIKKNIQEGKPVTEGETPSKEE
jgi:hypothetical protein